VPLDQIEIVAFRPDHVDGAVRLSREAGWPHRREDWAMVLAIGAGFVAMEAGRVVGTAMLTRFGNVANVGLVIVDPALRGRRIGRRLMQSVLDAAADCECRLVATPDGLALYRGLGFQPVADIAQHQGVLIAPTPPQAEIAWAGPDRLPDIVALDRAASGTDRTPLIRAICETGRVAMLRNGRGFAVLRPFGRGEVAGPVVAPTAEEARALLSFLFAARDGAFMRVDTETASGLAPFLAAHGLARVDSGLLMRRGEQVAALRNGLQIFALASQALG
jgi:predicted N-acetyltransferase YhbS